MLAIGLWIHRAIREAVVSRTAGVTALYVDSFIAPVIQDFADLGEIPIQGRERLDALLSETSFGNEIVAFKIWDRRGEILYSPRSDLIGRTFEMADDLTRAFDGEVVSKVSTLEEPENVYERTRWDSLIETYAPVRLEGSDRIVAVSEFYQLPDALESEIRQAQVSGWLIVGAATIIMYLALADMVRRATNTIRSQSSELKTKVEDLEATLRENTKLQHRIQSAASRTTALNEQYLRRVSADIHDGPAQEVAFALMRMDHIAESVTAPENGAQEEIETLRRALASALDDMRAIAQGLRSPISSEMGPCEAARRAVGDYERIYGQDVVLDCMGEETVASVATGITVYRIVQESLANSYKHAGVNQVHVSVHCEPEDVVIAVRDDGAGFDASRQSDEAHLGIAGMRERVEMIGGTFDVRSAPGQGAAVVARIPLSPVRSDV